MCGATGAQASPPANAENSPEVSVDSVSCASAGNCTAGGSYTDTAGAQQGLLLTETSGVWATGAQASLPSNAGSNPDTNMHAKVVSVSCAAAGNCTAVGGYIDSSGLEQGLMLTETAGVWATGVEELTPPAGTPSSASVFLNSVSCASAGDCTAVGYYGDFPTGLFHGVHRYDGLLLTETSGVWRPGLQASAPTTAGPPATTGTNLRVVVSPAARLPEEVRTRRPTGQGPLCQADTEEPYSSPLHPVD